MNNRHQSSEGFALRQLNLLIYDYVIIVHILNEVFTPNHRKGNYLEGTYGCLTLSWPRFLAQQETNLKSRIKAT